MQHLRNEQHPAADRALVTGATGFIGSHLVDALLARGWRVRCVVRSRERARSLAALPVELVDGDLLDEDRLAEAMAGADYVFHVAGLTKGTDEGAFQRINTEGTARVLRACARACRRVKRVVVVSSLAAAGPAFDGVPLTEKAPCLPISAYGRSKLGAEQVTECWMADLPCTIIRPPVVYGPRDTDNLLFFRALAMGIQPSFSARQAVSLVHVRDLVEGLCLAATNPVAEGKTYFISGESADLDEIMRLIAKALGKKPLRIRLPLSMLGLAAAAAESLAKMLAATTVLSRQKVLELAQPAWLCSAQRAREELGFQPRVTLAEGVAQTARWYQAAHWL